MPANRHVKGAARGGEKVGGQFRPNPVADTPPGAGAGLSLDAGPDTADYRMLPGAGPAAFCGGRAWSVIRSKACAAGKFAARHPFWSTVALGAASGGWLFLPASATVGGSLVFGKKVLSYPARWAQAPIEGFKLRRQQRQERDESAKALYLSGGGSGIPYGVAAA